MCVCVCVCVCALLLSTVSHTDMSCSAVNCKKMGKLLMHPNVKNVIKM